MRITSFGDFKRRFGGLDLRSEASYAIQQYYVNGGSVAWVVRVDPGLGDATVGLKTSTVDLLGGSPLQTTLTVSAINPGEWGDKLRVIVEPVPTDSNLFNLVVREVDPKTVKTLPNSTTIDPASGRSSRRKSTATCPSIRSAATTSSASSIRIRIWFRSRTPD